MKDTLQKLTEVLEKRKSESPDKSYVASLYAKGMDKILEKVDEESGEVIEAARQGDPKRIIHASFFGFERRCDN